MSYAPDSQEQHKRKRDMDGAVTRSSHSDRIPQPPPPIHSGESSRINYLTKTFPGKLDLIPGDSDTFADVLGLINSYEGVLSRQESLASNLGAKLTGPRLLRAMEGAFEGPIIVKPSSPFGPGPVSWLDIVTFAKTNPGQFVLTTSPEGQRSCQFFLHGLQVEILEDDWRLIVNGALDRFSLTSTSPLEEDETAELATVDILEKRLQVLIKRADEVAKRARQLNYHLSGRKAAIKSRHPSPNTAFHHSGPARHPGGPSAAYDLHADLLQQFLSPFSSQPVAPRPIFHPDRDATHRHPPHANRTTDHHHQHHTPNTTETNNSPITVAGPCGPAKELPDPSEVHRPIVTSRIERLGKGDEIYPPCDRCRRLKTVCIKHLTACQGCTKRHAKCGWRGITEEEIAWLEREANHAAEPDAEANGASTTHTSGSRYDAVHDEIRHAVDDSVGSPAARGSGSRPTSRGAHPPLQPQSPTETEGRRHLASSIADVGRRPAPSPPRHWDRDVRQRSDHPGCQKDSFMSHMGSTTSSATPEAHEANMTHT
ncbi:hypothetical protein SODALDRAFT_322741 [Sodiomyces alkalinus F11]|uniref:Zn(2)-C6 fungal-type domain-containing protein n=1 Tax=Sodiomyces alkalinus (strain CBS 110278 / VKM F-3762 / F11) TaxID=1314773 RepID=A0A3N2Q4F9_SODAK|nr:hypothetical protein SODALDRAFT_322741 [Sodiomyces alkalinus F11]ROT41660.1 hypothetical protein SODALDRAFT_322741 [Sodiomyces alkalinus F11]